MRFDHKAWEPLDVRFADPATGARPPLEVYAAMLRLLAGEAPVAIYVERLVAAEPEPLARWHAVAVTATRVLLVDARRGSTGEWDSEVGGSPEALTAWARPLHTLTSVELPAAVVGPGERGDQHFDYTYAATFTDGERVEVPASGKPPGVRAQRSEREWLEELGSALLESLQREASGAG